MCMYVCVCMYLGMYVLHVHFSICMCVYYDLICMFNYIPTCLVPCLGTGQTDMVDVVYVNV